jgi:osmoprotectant transport system permease protein
MRLLADELVRWSWVRTHLSLIRDRVLQHLAFTAVAVGIGFVIAFFLSIVALRFRMTYAPITWVAGVLYTIPSLALFALLTPWTGLTMTTAEIGLVSYTLLVLVRNIVAGVDGVPEPVIEAARAMGYEGWRLFLFIQLPLAVPVIMAGVRIATVTVIGLVTVTALIGQGGLGFLILDGLQRFFNTEIIVGGALSGVLAAAFDGAFVLIERGLAPWAQRRQALA